MQITLIPSFLFEMYKFIAYIAVQQVQFSRYPSLSLVLFFMRDFSLQCILQSNQLSDLLSVLLSVILCIRS